MTGRADVVLAAAVGAIVVVAGVAAAVVSTRDAEQPAVGSPEAVVRDYVAALASGDLTLALTQLEPATACGLADLSRAYVPESLRAVLVGAEGDDESSVVTVEITENADEGPFGAGGWSHDERIVLHRVDGGWRIAGEPWPMFGCRDGGRG